MESTGRFHLTCFVVSGNVHVNSLNAGVELSQIAGTVPAANVLAQHDWLQTRPPPQLFRTITRNSHL